MAKKSKKKSVTKRVVKAAKSISKKAEVEALTREIV